METLFPASFFEIRVLKFARFWLASFFSLRFYTFYLKCMDFVSKSTLSVLPMLPLRLLLSIY